VGTAGEEEVVRGYGRGRELKYGGVDNARDDLSGGGIGMISWNVGRNVT
jgi:hypothetical protein